MDIGCMLYYHKPYRRKHHKTESSYDPKRLKKHSSSENTKRRPCFIIPKMSGCSLDHPCYSCSYDGDLGLDLGVLPMNNPKRAITFEHVQQVSRGECFHSNENDVAVYTAFTYPDCKNDEEDNKTKAEASECMGRLASSEVVKNCKDKMLRTYSCPPYHLKHVHPKLPDYDDLAAKFSALKREHLENKKEICCSHLLVM